MNLYMVSLGCAKNQVDTEMILGVCKNKMTLVSSPMAADLIMINTCAFIETARKEAIDTILSLADYKKEGAKLIVCGCLAQRYKDEISKLLPEVDRFISIDEYSNIRTLPNKIESLEEEIKQLKQAIFSCEIKKDLVKEFKETKLKLIKESTHTVFPQLDFEIMEVNVNTGAMKEVCYAKLKDVEYKGINDGHRKLVGIIIIEDIKKALGIDDLPIIFDKRADVDNDMLETIKKTTNAQIITTEVSDNETIINKGE